MENLGDILKRLPNSNISEDSTAEALPESEDSSEVCGRCGGRGWITQDVPAGHPDFGQAITCECQAHRLEQERYERLLRYSNLGNMARFTFETLSPDRRSEDAESPERFREAYQAALDYAEHPVGWLVFTGSNGSGKTHLAAAIGNRAVHRGHVVFFSHVSDLLDHLRATFSPTSDVPYSELFEQVRNTPLLILDGLGSHSTTSWTEEKLRQVINHRYDAELPTVITIAGALRELDQYILSRLQKAGVSRILELRSPEPDRVQRLGHIEPAMLQRMSFETFNVRGNDPTPGQRASLEAAYQAAKNFAADPDGWLVLFGDTGVGKTHLAVAIASERLKTGTAVFFSFVPELMDYLRYTFDPESPVTPNNFFEDIKNAELLVLDDLGQERSSPWANDKLYQIIVHRHNARQPTVITSMLDFANDTGPVGSRVQDPSVGQLIRIDARDFRNKKRSPRRQGSRSSGRSAAR